MGGVGQVQRDPPVVAGERAVAAPEDLAARRSARRGGRGSSRRPGPAGRVTRRRSPGATAPAQLLDGAHDAVRPRAAARRRPATRPTNRPKASGVTGSTSCAQRREAAAAQHPQHLGVAQLGWTRRPWAAAHPRRPGPWRPAGRAPWRRRRRRCPYAGATSAAGRAVGARVPARRGRRAGRRPARVKASRHADRQRGARARRGAGRRPRWRPTAPRRRRARMTAAPRERRRARPADSRRRRPGQRCARLGRDRPEHRAAGRGAVDVARGAAPA